MKGTQPTAANAPRALIEDVLDLTPVGTDSNTFTNTKPLWRPPGNRGIFGGIVIAQTLAAAQRTAPADAAATSMHCYFVLAGDGEVPILYHVDRVADHPGKAVRAVRAKQGERLIFTAMLNFSSLLDVGSGRGLERSVPVPAADLPPPDEGDGAWDSDRPFQSLSAGFVRDVPNPEDKKIRQWARARGPISPSGGKCVHLGALAYMTDSFLLGTVYRAHSVPRFSSPTALRRLAGLKAHPDPDREALHYFQSLADMEASELRGCRADSEDVCADEWMLSEMETPWAGDGRGLVTSRWWSRDGRLIATCVQEGVMRLKARY
ncbi:Histidine acid phosphatase [Aspergillus sp. HF37]|nr:Histidine acid phosphatase [Aspergillus sp. HF37]